MVIKGVYELSAEWRIGLFAFFIYQEIKKGPVAASDGKHQSEGETRFKIQEQLKEYMKMIVIIAVLLLSGCQSRMPGRYTTTTQQHSALQAWQAGHTLQQYLWRQQTQRDSHGYYLHVALPGPFRFHPDSGLYADSALIWIWGQRQQYRYVSDSVWGYDQAILQHQDSMGTFHEYQNEIIRPRGSYWRWIGVGLLLVVVGGVIVKISR